MEHLYIISICDLIQSEVRFREIRFNRTAKAQACGIAAQRGSFWPPRMAYVGPADQGWHMTKSQIRKEMHSSLFSKAASVASSLRKTNSNRSTFHAPFLSFRRSFSRISKITPDLPPHLKRMVESLDEFLACI